MDTHAIARRLRDKWAHEEPITFENFVIDTIITGIVCTFLAMKMKEIYILGQRFPDVTACERRRISGCHCENASVEVVRI